VTSNKFLGLLPDIDRNLATVLQPLSEVWRDAVLALAGEPPELDPELCVALYLLRRRILNAVDASLRAGGLEAWLRLTTRKEGDSNPAYGGGVTP